MFCLVMVFHLLNATSDPEIAPPLLPSAARSDVVALDGRLGAPVRGRRPGGAGGGRVQHHSAAGQPNPPAGAARARPQPAGRAAPPAVPHHRSPTATQGQPSHTRLQSSQTASSAVRVSDILIPYPLYPQRSLPCRDLCCEGIRQGSQLWRYQTGIFLL